MNSDLRALTAQIVSAFVTKNPVPADDLSKLIANTFNALANADKPATPPTVERPAPAVPIKKSVTASSITCLECGFKGRMIKRHIRTEHGMEPDAYRARWDLPPEYPMIAPEYAAQRSELAKKSGLGKARKRAAEKA